MRRTKLSKVLALTLVLVMLMSMTPASAYTLLSNKLTATVTVTPAALTPLQALNALNFTEVETDKEFKMQAALENTELGLDLTEYNKLTTGGRRQAVADFVSFVKFANGNFANVDAVQTALNLGVKIETDKMNLLQLLNKKTDRTLLDIVTAIRNNSTSIGAYSVDSINSFYGKYDGMTGINNEKVLMQSFLDLSEDKQAEATTLFLKNTYSGSYVTVRGYLQAAIAEVTTDARIALVWTAGGTITGDSLAIAEAKVGDTNTISFKATSNKNIDNIGYIITSDNLIRINNITALTHYIDSGNLTANLPETKNIDISFVLPGDINLTVEAIQQEDTTPIAISDVTLRPYLVEGKPRIELDFTLSEGINLDLQKLGDVIISYGTYNDGTFTETLRSNGTPIVKSKSWGGYLVSGGVNYSIGFDKSGTSDNLPGNQNISTVVDSRLFSYAKDEQWVSYITDNINNVAVKIIVIDNEGNKTIEIFQKNR